MIEIIAGEKGKGKTKHLLDKVNRTVKTAKGSIVYLDKSPKHMYELNNRIRLIDVAEYPISNCDEFMGFLCGILSQDRDMEEMYLDSFLTISSLKEDEMTYAIKKLDIISEVFRKICAQCVKGRKGFTGMCAGKNYSFSVTGISA